MAAQTHNGKSSRPGFKTGLISRRGATTLARNSWFATGLLLAVRMSPAQEALRQSVAWESPAPQRGSSESRPYTFRSRSGDFRLLVVPSLGLDWNDNINTSEKDPEDDFIARPLVQFDASYPITQRNLLSLNVGVGYDHYFEHSERSTLRLQSGSHLSFDIFVKDVWINLHERFSYTQDPSQEAAVANTSSFGTFNNAAGLFAQWNLGDVLPSIGYDHANVISLADRFRSQDRATDSFVARTGFRLHPQLITGLEGSAAFTTYADEILNNNSAYSAGVYADWQPGTHFHVQPRVGYTVYQFENTSESAFGISTSPLVRTDDLNSWYADLTVRHDITEAISYSITAGHGVRLGVQSDAIENWYVRPTVTWHILPAITLNPFFSYERGDAGEGNIQGNLTETYDWFSAGLGVNYQIMTRLTVTLNYRHTLRSSSSANREYAQNLVGLHLVYRLP